MKNLLLLLVILLSSCILCESHPTVYIVDENGKPLPGIIGPLNEGSRLSLYCETSGGVPSVLTWWKDTYLLDDSFVTMARGAVRNELTLAYLERSDLMSTLTCQAALPNSTEPSKTSISLDMNLKPLDVHITSLQRPLSANRRTTLKCQSSGSRPSATLTWWVGSKQLFDVTVATYEGTTISKLAYVPSPEDHGRVLSCRATNPVMNGNILEDHRVLNIHYIPELSVTVGTPRAFIVEGDVVYFDCNIDANPHVTEVGWRFNGYPLYTNIGAGIKVQNQSLLLHNIHKKFSGNYSCVAANSEGEGVSDPVTIDVHHIPQCLHHPRTSYGVPLRESVDILCMVEANPEAVKFQWFLNNTYRQFPLKNFIVNGTTSTLSFTPKRESDYGHVMCVAENSAGMQTEACCFHVSPASVPHAVEDCTVRNETNTTATVSCSPGFDGGLPQKFHIELYTSQGLVTTATAETEPVFELEDLPPGTSLIAVVFATNEQGRSNAVAFNVVTTADDKPEKSGMGLKVSPYLGILVGIMTIAVAAAVFFVVCNKPRSDRLGEEILDAPMAWEPEALKPENQQYI